MEDLNLRVKNLIHSLAANVQLISIYSPEHPQVRNSLDNLYRELTNTFARVNEITFGLMEDEIFYGKEIFLDLRIPLKEFIASLKDKNIEYIKFRRGVTKAELLGFLQILAVKPKSGGLDAEAILKDKNILNIEIGKFQEAEKSKFLYSKAGIDNKDLSSFNYQHESYLKAGQFALENIISGKEVDYESLVTFIKRILKVLTDQKDLLFIIMGIKKYDDCTFVHSLNVSALSMFQARNLGLPEELVVRIGLAGFFHDIGKIAITHSILDKKDQLIDDELSKIKNHVIYGAKLLFGKAYLDKLALVVSYQHHMGFSLEGYPKGEFTSSQNLASRIIAISDVYDALRSRRSYKENLPLERVYEIMQKESGRLLDPALLKEFFNNLGVWPVGCLVRLDTQEIGLVVENNPQDIFRPKVKIFYDAQGKRLDQAVIEDLTDKDERGSFKRRILHYLSPHGEGQKFISEIFGDI